MALVYYPQVATDYYWIKGQWRFCYNATFCNNTNNNNIVYGTSISQYVANRLISPYNWDPATPWVYGWRNFTDPSKNLYVFCQVNINDWPNAAGIGVTVPKPTQAFPNKNINPGEWVLPYFPAGYYDNAWLFAYEIWYPLHIDYPAVKETTSKGNSKQSMRTKGGKYQSIKNL